MKTSCITAGVLLMSSAASIAVQTVSGNKITWPNDGWYQIQRANDYSEVYARGGVSYNGGFDYRAGDLASGNVLTVTAEGLEIHFHRMKSWTCLVLPDMPMRTVLVLMTFMRYRALCWSRPKTAVNYR